MILYKILTTHNNYNFSMMIGDRRQKPINYTKKKKLKSTKSKSSTDEDVMMTEPDKVTNIISNDLNLVEEGIYSHNNIVQENSLDPKTKKRKSNRNSKLPHNQKIDIYLTEKDNKPSISNINTNFYTKSSLDTSRKISEITDVSIVDSNLALEKSKPIANLECCSFSPVNKEISHRPTSPSESLTEIKSNQLNFSEFKMEDINLDTEKLIPQSNLQSENKLCKSLSFSSELKTQISSYIVNYSPEELDETYNFESCIYEEEENLLSERDPNYFQRQGTLNPRMRTILLDWIMEVCGQLSFKRATFHTAVVLIDIFLSKVENLQTNLLQLTGITCLIIAAKNEVI
jgi:hypothetical protein